MGTLHKFTLPSGEVVTRKSHHAYTHVVLGQRNLAAERASHLTMLRSKTTESNFIYYRKKAACKPGDVYHHSNQLTSIVTQAEIDEAMASLNGCTTLEAYREMLVADFLSRTAGVPDLGPVGVLQWSKSLANASKGATKFSGYGFVNVHVCEVDPPEKSISAMAEQTADGIESGLTGPDWEPTAQERYFAQKGEQYAFGPSEAEAIAALHGILRS